MKNEINLRTREFTITREFYWPRIFATLAVILLIVIFVGGSVFVYLYQVQLETENNVLAQEKKDLEVRAAPLEEMEAEIGDLEKRERMAAALLEDLLPWSAHFRTINRIAAKQGLRTTSLSASAGSGVRITGDSASMSRIARFVQALEAVDGSSGAVYKYMNLTQDNRFNYEIELDFAAGGDQ